MRLWRDARRRLLVEAPLLAEAPLFAEARLWLGGGWSHWGERRGWLEGAAFNVDDVLATDWRWEQGAAP